jgi:DNA-binding CsgD family transcriptional regulator
MSKSFVTLNPRKREAAALLANIRALSIWEMLRRFKRAATLLELAHACALPVNVVQDALDVAVDAGIASRARGKAGTAPSQVRYRVLGERIFAQVDPKSPADAALMRQLFAMHLADSRACVELSLADAARGQHGFGLKHAFTHVTMDEAEAKELLALFGPIDAFVDRLAEKYSGNPSATPRRCNYHLAFHVAPISIERLPPAHVDLARPGTLQEKVKRSERSTSSLLSPREVEVARKLVAGDTVPKIAESLGVSRSTVSTLNERIYRKLGITRRAQLAMRLHELGVQ